VAASWRPESPAMSSDRPANQRLRTGLSGGADTRVAFEHGIGDQIEHGFLLPGCVLWENHRPAILMRKTN
jgi:hypothetical protein